MLVILNGKSFQIRSTVKGRFSRLSTVSLATVSSKGRRRRKKAEKYIKALRQDCFRDLYHSTQRLVARFASTLLLSCLLSYEEATSIYACTSMWVCRYKSITGKPLSGWALLKYFTEYIFIVLERRFLEQFLFFGFVY